jgi:hypothetical protein
MTGCTHARVGRTAVDVGVDVRPNHPRVVVVGEVEHVVRDVELGRDAAGVLDVGGAAAPGVGLAAPQLERDAGDVVAALDQQRGRDRRVDAAAHRDSTRVGPAVIVTLTAGRSCSTPAG